MTGGARAIRAAFQRAAADYDRHAFLQQEVARRLDDHFEGLRIAPEQILDAGCGTGFGAALLRARFPQARLLAMDVAPGMTLRARQRLTPGGWRAWLPSGWRAARCDALCAAFEQIPLRARSVDLIWSSLTLQWTDGPRAFAEAHRVLKPGGLILFATLGPDTLHELRAAGAGVNDFVDMHDVGDALVAAGFVSPVMEMERLTLTYADLRGLLRDIKGIGARTVLRERRAGLMGKQAWARLESAYEAFRRDGRLPATYEVVYGHAWAGEKTPGDAVRPVLRMDPGARRRAAV